MYKNEIDYISKRRHLHIYVDSCVVNGKFHPITSRIYIPERHTVEVCVYPISRQAQQNIIDDHVVSQQNYYWLDFLKNADNETLPLVFNKHIDQFDVTHISSVVMDHLFRNKSVILYSRDNHTAEIEKHFGLEVLLHYNVNSLASYNVDFFLDIFSPFGLSGFDVFFATGHLQIQEYQTQNKIGIVVRRKHNLPSILGKENNDSEPQLECVAGDIDVCPACKDHCWWYI